MKTKNEDRKRKISNPKFSSAQLYSIFLRSYLDIASVFTFYLPVLKKFLLSELHPNILNILSEKIIYVVDPPTWHSIN